MTDADYVDFVYNLANTPAQRESLVYIMKQAAGDICLNVNLNKTEYI